MKFVNWLVLPATKPTVMLKSPVLSRKDFAPMLILPPPVEPAPATVPKAILLPWALIPLPLPFVAPAPLPRVMLPPVPAVKVWPSLPMLPLSSTILIGAA